MNPSRSRQGPEDLAKEVGVKARELAGLLRRMIVTRTRSALWQITGHDLRDIGGELETRDAEVFGGIGFASRPQEGGDAGAVEAIVAFPQGGKGPIVIGARQEAARRIVALDLEADETQMHGAIGAGGTIIRILADGTAEIRTAAGAAGSLMTKADGEALRSAIQGAATTGGDGGAAFKAAILAAWPGPTGTSVLKAE